MSILDRTIALSLRYRLVCILLYIALLLYGTQIFVNMPIDVFPDLNRPNVVLLTEAPGLAPEEVEALVTRPLELSMRGLSGVERLRSSSGIGLSVLTVEFSWGSDVYLCRQQVNEKLNIIRNKLPRTAVPIMAPITSIMGEIMLLGISSEDGSQSPMELRTFADWDLRPLLQAVPGVAQVVSIGGELRQFHIRLLPQRMRQYAISLQEVEKALGTSFFNTAGGFFEKAGNEYLIRNIVQTKNIEELRDTVLLQRGGVSITLREIADVTISGPIKRGDAGIGGKPGVIVSIKKQPGANTLDIANHLRELLGTYEKTLPKGTIIKPLFEQSHFIRAAVSNVQEALRDGGILVVLILALFLASLRPTLITLTAIPLSLVVSILVLRAFGLSINTMTLGGMAIAIGELVDDAIVDVENIMRRLRENAQLPTPRPMLDVIFSASSEIRNSIVYATIIVLLVFLPLFFIGGIEGRLFAPMGVAYIAAITASLVVSLTLTPVLCSFAFARWPAGRTKRDKGDNAIVRQLKRWDEIVLRAALSHPRKIVAGSLLLVAIALGSAPFLGREFLPAFNEGTATVNVLAMPGSSLATSNAIGTYAEKLLLEIPEVSAVGRRTGRAEEDEHAEGVHYSEIDVDLRPSQHSRAEILAAMRAKLADIPGVFVSIGQPISHRLDHLLSGIRAQVAIKIFGDDMELLRNYAAIAKREMKLIPGVVDLQIEQQVLIPQLTVNVSRDATRRYGINMGQLGEELETLLQGKVVGQIVEGQRSSDVILRLNPADLMNNDAIASMPIDTPANTKLPLSAVAQFKETQGPNLIQRENGRRRLVVTCNIAGRDLGSTVTAISKALSRSLQLPQGYTISLDGQYQSQQRATRWITLLSLLAMLIIAGILYGHFRSANVVAQIMLNIPLALVGSIIALWTAENGVLSIASLVGLVTLCGIAARNGIMMISHYVHLVEHEGESFGPAMIIRGSLERLVPVLMTSLTAGLALLPLAFSQGAPGKEILQPMAVVILGGLMSSTLLDMFVTPAVFSLFGEKALARLRESRDNAWHPPRMS